MVVLFDACEVYAKRRSDRLVQNIVLTSIQFLPKWKIELIKLAVAALLFAHGALGLGEAELVFKHWQSILQLRHQLPCIPFDPDHWSLSSSRVGIWNFVLFSLCLFGTLLIFIDLLPKIIAVESLVKVIRFKSQGLYLDQVGDS